MATDLDYDRLRADTGQTCASLPDNEAEAIFVEAATLYTGARSQRAGARVIVLTRLLSKSAALTDYTQDTTTEKQSQVFDHLERLLGTWQTALDKALADEVVASVSASNRSLRVPVQASW